MEPKIELIVGADGFIGKNLCRHLPNAARTSRRGASDTCIDFNMLEPALSDLPNADVVYLCAGVNGTLTCAREPQLSWRVNVDGTIWVADHIQPTSFLVWLSSTTVEWLDEDYGKQKRVAESYLRALPNVGVVRAGRVLQSNVDDLCKLMINIGRERKRGVQLWNQNEKPYHH